MNDWQAYQALNMRLRRAEKQQRQQQASVEGWDDPQFRVRPTCPPSTSVIMRGGRATAPMSWGDGYGGHVWFVQNYTIDLTTSGSLPKFTTAYWYIPVICFLYEGNDPYDYGLRPAEAETRFVGAGVPGASYFLQYETAAEAEEAIATPLDDYDAYYNGLVLCFLILRNNGTLGTNEFQPIDAVNRGRSYIWRREIRLGYVW